MKPINDSLADVLRTVKTPGDFCTSGSCPMHLPLIQVDGVGPIALPLLPVQAAQLIAAAERAPYGLGGETLVDIAVRRTWQIGAERVHIGGKHWPAMLEAIVERAAAGLGAGQGVVAELYKMLVYDEGSFFVSHRDTEKAPGMFATLIVALPSLHAGGELLVRHREREVRLELRSDDLSEVAFAAFYADCLHEVLPVTAGCRVALVYNLLRHDKGKGKLPRPPSYERETAALAALLRHWCGDEQPAIVDQPLKLVYPLAHAYTPAELSFAALKGADAAAAGALAAAARDAACELHVALLRIEESGSAEHMGYRGSRSSWRTRRDQDHDDSDEFEIGEIFDRSLTLAHWSRPDGSTAALGVMPFEDEEVCPADAIDAMEPDEQHFEEATGNEGASFERSYQRAALVLWPQSRRLDVLADAGFDASLPYLAGLVTLWLQAGAEPDAAPWRDAKALVGQMLGSWPRRAGPTAGGDQSAVAAVLTQLVRMRDSELIETVLNRVCAAGDYGAEDNPVIVQALDLLPPPRVGELTLALMQANAGLHVRACADLLARCSAHSAWQAGLRGAANALLDALPGGPKPAQAHGWQREPADAAVLHDLLRALGAIDTSLAERAVSHTLAWPKHFGFDTVIVPALRRLVEHSSVLNQPAGQRLGAAALAHLHARVALELAPPADWRREADVGCRCEHCRGLSGFLTSASQEVWRFKAPQGERSHVEATIRSGHLDLDFSTERKGSPHVLLCTKNQASYERRVEQRRCDLENLARLAAAFEA